MFNEIVTLHNDNTPFRFFTVQNSDNKPCESPIHYHSEIELLKMDKGFLLIDIDDKKITLKENDIILINSNIPHLTFTETEAKAYVLQINLEKLLFNKNTNGIINLFFPATKKYMYLSRNCEENTMISEYVNGIRDESIKRSKGFNAVVRGYLNLIVGLMINMDMIILPENIIKNSSYQKIKPVITYIEAHYNEYLTIDDLSGSINLSPNYFCNLFKSAMGISCFEYINIIRIIHAEELMFNTNKNILEISMEVGYSSVSYFNRIFKKIKGCSPAYYRKMKINTNNF